MKVRSSVIFNEEFNGDLGFDLRSLLQGHFKVNFFFQMKTYIFDTANRKSGKFYVQVCIKVQGRGDL